MFSMKDNLDLDSAPEPCGFVHLRFDIDYGECVAYM